MYPSFPLPLRSDGTTRPVPKIGAGGANAGLVFNKFVNEWTKNDEGAYGLHNGKGKWLDKFVGELLGDADQLKRYHASLRNIAKLCGAGEDGEPHAPFFAQNITRFVTGIGLSHPLENGFHWHHTLGMPYLPGSGQKGMALAWARERGLSKEDIEILFGTQPDEKGNESTPRKTGALIFFDALPEQPVQLVKEVLTPHDGSWRLKGPGTEDPPLSPADWHNPIPVPYLAVEAGQSFGFYLGVRPGAGIDEEGNDIRQIILENGYLLLREALEWHGFGAKTAVGFGRFVDPKVAEDRRAEEKGGFVKGALVRVGNDPAVNKRAHGRVMQIEKEEDERGFIILGQAEGHEGKPKTLPVKPHQIELYEE